MIVPMAAEAALVQGKDIREFITNHRDPFDFMLRGKIPRSAKLVMRWNDWNVEQQLQNTTRFFISRNGGSLIKLMPPTGEPGTWKRKNGVKDEVYQAVLNELKCRDIDFTDLDNVDEAGVLWDERIHTKSRSKHAAVRETAICSGYLTTECADAADFDWSSLNYQWYINEAEKLVLPLL